MIAESCDICVIGGGILGLGVAARTARRKCSVNLFRLSNQGRPRADTLRNQGWLQSGLMYVGKLGKDRTRGRQLARQMYFGGRTMLEELRLPLPGQEQSGVLCVHGEKDANHLVEDAQSLGIASLVRELDADTARRRLGPIFEDAARYFSIPDAPFPEGRVLRLLRDEATKAGTGFIECEAPVRLRRERQSPSGICVECYDRCFCPRAVILAAGAGSYELIRSLDLDPRMKIQQTPLLVVEGDGVVSVPIFVHRPRGFSFVLHPPEEKILPNGALVIATNIMDENAPYRHYDDRSILDRDVADFIEILPPHLKPLAADGRFTAGYEVIPNGVKDADGNDQHYLEPWVEWLNPDEDGFNLLLAMPGRATLGGVASDMVLDRLEERMELPPTVLSKLEVSGRWDGDIFMHFHRYYDFDDRERNMEGN